MSKFIPNSFQIPNAFVDELLGELSGNSVKCYLLIARKTTGWQKESDFIAVSQFMEMCNIKDRKTVFKVLAELEEVGLIRSQKTNGTTTEFFLVRELPEREHTVETSTQNPHQYQKTTPVGKNGTAPVPKIHTATSTKNWHSTKDNINTKNNTPPIPPQGEPAPAEIVLDYLNTAVANLAAELGEHKPHGFKLQPWAKNISARIAESSVAECCQVVDYLVAKWGRDGKMREYLCPKTIFRASNFADYLPKSTAWAARGKPVCVNGKWVAPAEVAKRLIAPSVDEVKTWYQKSLGIGNPFKTLDFSDKRNLVLYHATIATKNKKPLERELLAVISQSIKDTVERAETLRVPSFE